MKAQLYINGERVELFKDELITVNSSVANVQDISKVFSDYSQTFTVPASPNNNRIFEHWYQTDVVPNQDNRLRRDAFIEVELIPFRFGKIQLNEAVIRDGRVVSYSLTFFGAITSLKDRFGEDELKDLDYSPVGFTYDGTEVYNRLIDGTTSYDVRFPLVAPNRFWSDSGINDITTTGGRINYYELFPAVRVQAIFNFIETKYNLSFTSSFFQTAKWLDLYCRFQNGQNLVFLTEYENIDYNSTTPSNTFFNTIDNTLSYQYVPIVGQTFHKTTVNFSSVSDATATIYVEAYINGQLAGTFESYGGTNPTIVTIEGNVPGLQSVLTYRFRADKTVSFDVDVLYEAPDTTIYTGFGNNISLLSIIDLSILAPKMKVADFVAGILKVFNLVVVGEDADTFTIEPLQDWYNLGTTYDITKHVVNSHNVQRVPLYKQIAFNYKESKSFPNRNFRQLFNREYGNLASAFPYDGSEFKIDLPFENNQFTEISNWGIFVAYCLDENYSGYVPEPMLMYLSGDQVCTSFKFYDGTTEHNITNYALFNSVNTTGFSLCFGNEFNIVTQQTEPDSLYNTYYSGHLSNLYDIQQRLFSFTALLPTGLITKLRMNDKLIIHDKRYLINDISTTLNTGEVKLNLLRELVVFEFDCDCVRVSFTYEGVDYVFEMDKDSETSYSVTPEDTPFETLFIELIDGVWSFGSYSDEVFIVAATMGCENECPFCDEWTILEDFQELVSNLTTTPCE